jgi:manganese transport protein
MRFIEAIILVLVTTIGVCYFIEIFVLPQTNPSFLEMGRAVLSPGFRQDGMILLAIAIIGATVMPHNLYLHSALVQSRQLQENEPAVKRAIRFNTIDTVLALAAAFLINAAILVLAALVFHGKDSVTLPDGKEMPLKAKADPASTAETDSEPEEPDWIRVAYVTLTPLLGTAAASILFAVALFASGQSSTITGTLAGQVVMEGFMRWRIAPWQRRLLTRLLAILPAIFIIGMREDQSVTDLLNLSQVVLALQLPLAMFPLLHFTSSRKWMGEHRNGWFLLIAGWGSCLLITALDLHGLPKAIQQAWEVIVGK